MLLLLRFVLGVCLLSSAPLFADSSENIEKAETPQTFASASAPASEGLDVKPTSVIHWQPITTTHFKDGKLLLVLRLSTEQGFAIYKEKLAFDNNAGFFIEELIEPKSRWIEDPILGKRVEIFEGGEFRFLLSSLEPLKGSLFPFSVTFVGCQGRICLYPYVQKFELSFLRSDDNAPQVAKRNLVEGSAGPSGVKESHTEPRAVDETNGEDWGTVWAQKIVEGRFALSFLLIVVFLAGLLTNLTPCVYPMIPITIRVLSGQGTSPFFASSCYAGGIILTYTALGVFAGLSGSLFGSILSSTPVNLAFAIVMIVLGISMLGVFDFSLFQRFAPKIGKGKASAKNAFLMGVGAGFIASPCTGPILAALITFTAKEQDVLKSTLLLFVYSFGFALPYVFLGGLAGSISRVKLSYKVQIVVKLLFASIMLALGFYYLRIPLHRTIHEWHIDQNWLIATKIFVSFGILLTIIWLGVARLQESKVFSLFLSFVLGLSIFSLSQWLTGAAPKTLAKSEKSSLNWESKEVEALALAKRNGVPLLIDGWAEWCEACKKMEATTFQDTQVVELLQKQGWILLKLDLTESNDENDAIQEKYGFYGLPTLILLPPNGDVSKKKSLSGFVTEKTLISALNDFYKSM